MMLEALQARLVFASVDDFYLLARACLVKDEVFDRLIGLRRLVQRDGEH